MLESLPKLIPSIITSLRLKVGLFLFISLVITQLSYGQAVFRSNVSGNWSSSATWAILSGSDGDGIPDSNDDVIVRGGNTVTVDVNSAANSLQIAGNAATGTTGSGTLSIAASISLAVTNAVTVGGDGNSFRRGNLNFAAGSALSATSLTFGSSNATPGTPNTINMTAGGTLTVGLILVNTGGGTITNTWTQGTGTVVLNATNTLPTAVFTTFNNLTINGGTTSLGVNLNVSGTLSVSSGSLNLLTFNLTSVGAINMTGTSITGSGTINLAGGVSTAASSTTAVISAPVALGAANRTFNVANGGLNPDLSVTSVVSGTAGLAKSGAGTLTLSGANTFSGGVTLNAGTLNINNATAIGSGTFTIGGGTIANTSGSAISLSNNNAQAWNGDFTFNGTQNLDLGTGTVTFGSSRTVTVNSNTLNVGGAISASANDLTKVGSGTLSFGANNVALNNLTLSGPLTSTSGTLSLTGTFTNAGAFNNNSGTVSYVGSSSQTITNVTYNNLTLSGAGQKNASTSITVNGNLNNSSVFDLAGNSLTVTGTTTNTGGTLRFSGAANGKVVNTGTVEYYGAVTQTVVAGTYNNLTLSGAGQKNASSALTASGNLTNSATLDMAGNTLTVSGTLDNTSGTVRFSGISNGLALTTGTVEYYGTSQNITAGTYSNLTINQGSGNASLLGTTTVTGILTLNAGNLILGSNNLMIGASGSITDASPSASRMIVASGTGEVRKTFASVGAFTFPVGDNVGTIEYSPITINVTSGSFSSAFIGVSLTNSKHPNNASATNYLNRYWKLNTSGITAGAATITANYVAADISGTEGSIKAAQLNGTFNQTTNPWTKFSALGSNTLTATNATLTSGQVSAFTGITGADPTVSITGGGVSVCAGTPVSLSTTVTGDPSFVYSWSPAAGLSSPTISNPVATPSSTTTYTVSARDGNGIVATANTTITVYTVPTVNAIANQTVCNGSSTAAITFSGTSATSFTWVNDTPSIGLAATGTGDIAGFAAVNTGTTPVTATITVTPVNGTCNGSTKNFTITVNPSPILTSIAQAAPVCAGTGATINLTGLIPGSTSTINYSINGTAQTAVTGVVANGAGAANFSSAALVSANDGQSLEVTSVTITSATPNCTQTFTKNLILSVNTQATITTQPTATQTLCTGTTLTLSVGATGTGLSYQWKKGGTNIGGATSSTYTIASVSTLDAATYTVDVTSSGVCAPATVTSTNAVVNVNQVPTGTTVPAGTYQICSGTTLNITPSSNVVGTTFTWTGNNGSGGSGVINDTPINSTTNPFDVTYTIVPTGPGVTFCVGAPFTIVVTVSPIPSITNSVLSTTMCSGGGALSFTPSINVSGSTYSWTSTIVSGTFTGVTAGPVNNSPIVDNPVNTGNTIGVIRYRITPTGPSPTSCVGNFVDYVVTVNPSPSFIITNNTTSICSGTVTDITLTTPTVNGVMTLTAINYGGATGGTQAVGNTFVSGQKIAETLTNPGTTPQTITYTFSVSVNGCNNPTPQTTTVTLKASPVITNTASQLATTICSGTALSFTPTSSIGGTSYTWTSSVTGTISAGSVTSGPSSAMPISDSPVNTGNSAGIVTYMITPSYNGCSGTPVSYVVTVSPIPTASATDQAICSGTQTSIAITNPNSVSGTTYAWTISASSNVTGATAGSGNLISQLLSSTDGVTSGSVTYSVVPTANGCSGSAVLVTATVKPVPVITNTATQLQRTICSGTSLSFTPTSSVSGTTYTWTSVVSGPLTGVSASGSGAITNTPVNTGNVIGTIIYHITPSLSGCDGAPKDYTVTVNPVPSANGSNLTICSGQTATITINAGPKNVSGTTFSWIVIPTSNVVGAYSDNGSTIIQTLSLSDYNVGSVIFRVTPTANNCNGPTKDIVVTIDPVALVDAGIDYALCQPTTIPLTGTIGGASTSGTWQIVTGSGSISSSTVSGSTVTATYTVSASDIASTVVFRLVTNDPDGAGPCVAVSDLLNVAVNKAATVTLPADYSVCEPSSISLTGTIGGSATTGLWSVVTGGGSLSATNVSGTTVTASYGVAPSDVSTVVTFRLTSNDPDGFGPCTTVSKDINITINRAAKVFAPANLALCKDVPSIALGGSIGGSTTSTVWSGGTGVFSNPSLPNSSYSFSAAETPTNATGPITVTLTLTALDPDGSGPCAAVSTQTLLKINPLPVVVFSGFPSNGVPPHIAENDTPISLTGNQIGGVFTIAPASSFIGATTQNPVDNVTFDPSVTFKGTNTVTYTYTDANGCTNSNSQDILVTQVTNIDFTLVYSNGTGVPQNANFEYQLCAEQGLISLIGSPLPNGDPVTKFSIIGASSSFIVNSGSQWYLDTNGLPSGTYTIGYTYRNAQGATSPTKYKVVDLFAHPMANINVNSTCINNAVTFMDASSMPTTNPFAGVINGWDWNLDDNIFRSQQNPTIFYDPTNPGNKNITLTVRTNQGCTATATSSIKVGDFPITDFSWSSICTFDKTNFVDKTVFKSGQGTIVQYTWDFGDGSGTIAGGPSVTVTGNASTTGTYENPKHVYSSNGSYLVTMTVLTDVGCTQSITKTVNILITTTGLQTPSPAHSYFETFQSDAGGWIPEAFNTTNSTPSNTVLSNYSWVWGIANGNTIQSLTASDNVWWTGGNSGSYYDYESSAINGPCFNLTQLNRPFIALDYWVDANENYDGAVLQYSTDGGLNWSLIGPLSGLPIAQRDQGVNWYKPGATIVANPGNQPIAYGWTGNTGKWLNGRFNLDLVPVVERQQVRIRIAFASNGPSAGTTTYDGFGFDNVMVGEKTRQVLVEHFTNANLAVQGVVAADQFMEDRYNEQTTIHNNESDFIDIQYHVRFPQPDIFDVQATGDASSRASFYQIQIAPYSVMDGNQKGKFAAGDYSQLSLYEIDRRALRDPQVSIVNFDTVAIVNKSKSASINVKFDVLADTAINFPLIANIALIEKQVVIPASDQNPGTYRNVVRKLLLGPNGSVINKTFAKNDTYSFTSGEVDINTVIKNPNGLRLVAFVQNFNTKEILQSGIIDGPRKNGSVITAIENTPSTQLSVDNITIYPNPANHRFNFGLPGDFPAGCIWKISDQRGINVMSGDFEDAANGVKTVDISGLTNGMYMVAIGAPGQLPVYKKLVVLNVD